MVTFVKTGTWFSLSFAVCQHMKKYIFHFFSDAVIPRVLGTYPLHNASKYYNSSRPKLMRTSGCNSTKFAADISLFEPKIATGRPHFRTPYRTGAPLDQTRPLGTNSCQSTEGDGPLKKKPRRCEPFDSDAAKKTDNNKRVSGNTLEVKSVLLLCNEMRVRVQQFSDFSSF